MRILIVKLTSMGDVLHVLPALQDLSVAQPKVTVDWMVEDSFAEIPAWHPKVKRVIKVSTRRWRRLHWIKTWSNLIEFLSFTRTLRREKYDVILDAQGLMKSSLLARLAKRKKGGYYAGYSSDSIKESPAAWLYSKKIPVEREQHAVLRLRKLFANCFNYTLNTNDLDHGIHIGRVDKQSQPSIMLLHGTTWTSKHLPDTIWRELADLINNDGYKIKLCWGNEQERQRAEWIAQQRPYVSVLDKSTLNTLAQELKVASGVIAVDTGLGHMAAALEVPCVSVYGSTNSTLTGTVGKTQNQLQSDYPCSPCLLKQCNKLTAQVKSPPCYQRLDAATIWQALHTQIA